jgi:hypothetical protein
MSYSLLCKDIRLALDASLPSLNVACHCSVTQHSTDMLCCCLLPLTLPSPSPALQLEVTLGRIAMIGFVGLILNEAYFQRAFFPHLF